MADITTAQRIPLNIRFNPQRPETIVVACSDGRLQEATDAFLAGSLKIRSYDRLYVPGGPGAIAKSGLNFFRSERIMAECDFLIKHHKPKNFVFIFHGPAPDGSPDAMCGDYKNRFPWASPADMKKIQEEDARDIAKDFRKYVAALFFRCEIGGKGDISFVTINV